MFNPSPKTIYISLLLAFSGMTHAADINPENEATDTELSEIVVTARGVQEKSLDAPLTVHTLSGAEINRRQFTSVQDSLKHIPGVDIHDGGDPGMSYMWIRGVGAVSHTSLDDNSVGVRVDGVNQGLLGLASGLYDIDQLEVAKGPQGTLFGSSSEAGTVNVKSRNPTPYFGANMEVGYASNQQRSLKGMVNIPLAEDWAFRLAGSSTWQDNYVLERTTGDAVNKQKNQSVRGKLLWTPQVHTQIMLTGHHSELNNFMPMVMTGPFVNDDSYLTLGDIPHYSKRQTSGVDLDFSHQWDSFQINAKTAYLHHQGDASRALYALEYLAKAMPQMLPYFSIPANNLNQQQEENRNFEQEITLSSLPESDVKWIGGLYYGRFDRDFNYAWSGQGEYARQYVHNNMALFGELTYPWTSKLSSITGLRLAHDTTRYHADYQKGNVIGQDSQKFSDTTLTGRLGLDYAFTPNWHVYGTYSRGHKPAGYNDYGTQVSKGKQDLPYDAGHIDAFELGLKGGAEDGHWGMALALFHNQIKNDKLSVYVLPDYVTESFNVDTKSQGIELSGFIKPHPYFSLKSSLSFIDAKVTSTPDDPSIVSTSVTTEAGNRIPEVPRFAASLGVEYKQPVSISFLKKPQAFANVDLRYVGSRPAQADNKLQLKSYTLVDAALGIQDQHHELSLWAKNLTNERYMTYAMMQGTYELGIQAQGRSVGVKYKYEF